jgi:hypothetical protein
MFERFDNNFQNQRSSLQNIVPNNSTDFDPYYQDQSYGNPIQNGIMPNNLSPDMMSPEEEQLTPSYSSQPTEMQPTGYASGGGIKGKKKASNGKNNPFPSLAEMIRQQGNGEDSILAHINPIEAMILKQIGGSGTINKKTGLPQFGLFDNPKKWLKGSLGGGLGAVLGNMLLPGVGGILGGALGGAAGSAVRGRKDFGSTALRGGLMGAAAPTVAGLLGSGANALGATGLGSTLTNYGNANAILPALGMGSKIGSAGGLSGVRGFASAANQPASVLSSAANTGGMEAAAAGSPDFWESLGVNTSKYLSKPKNLLALASTVGQLSNRPKAPKEKAEKSPEQLGDEYKRLQKSMILTPGELAALESDSLARKQSERRVERNKFLPEERIKVDPLYYRSNTPEEFKKQGRWMNAYNNPEFSGQPIPYREGGDVSNGMFEEEGMNSNGLGYYLSGQTKGQDDKIPAKLSDGEFVIPADVVSDAGDGNNDAGANEFYKLMHNIRKHKRGGKVGLPPKAKSLASYMRK